MRLPLPLLVWRRRTTAQGRGGGGRTGSPGTPCRSRGSGGCRRGGVVRGGGRAGRGRLPARRGPVLPAGSANSSSSRLNEERNASSLPLCGVAVTSRTPRIGSHSAKQIVPLLAAPAGAADERAAVVGRSVPATRRSGRWLVPPGDPGGGAVARAVPIRYPRIVNWCYGIVRVATAAMRTAQKLFVVRLGNKTE